MTDSTGVKLEARAGIEPANKGFADPWLGQEEDGFTRFSAGNGQSGGADSRRLLLRARRQYAAARRALAAPGADLGTLMWAADMGAEVLILGGQLPRGRA